MGCPEGLPGGEEFEFLKIDELWEKGRWWR
jgi:hypothetical protein